MKCKVNGTANREVRSPQANNGVEGSRAEARLQFAFCDCPSSGSGPADRRTATGPQKSSADTYSS